MRDVTEPRASQSQRSGSKACVWIRMLRSSGHAVSAPACLALPLRPLFNAHHNPEEHAATSPIWTLSAMKITRTSGWVIVDEMNE